VSYGKPAACLMYDLAYHLAQDSANMLWLALVGLTDHVVHNRISGGWVGGWVGAGNGRWCVSRVGWQGESSSTCDDACDCPPPVLALLLQLTLSPFLPLPACLPALPAPPSPCPLTSACLAADKYLEYYMHYETYVSSAGHLDFQVGGWASGWAVCRHGRSCTDTGLSGCL
jgi:hypothetical protein